MKTSSRTDVARGYGWSRWLLSAAVAAGLTVAFAPASLADGLDASVTRFTNSSFGNPQMAQVYTALNDGSLYQIAFYAGTSWSYAPVTIEVDAVIGGLPVAGPIAITAVQTQNSVLGANLGWRTYPLNPTVHVSKGATYALVAKAGTFGTLGNYLHWGYTNFSNANFTGGKMLVRSSNGASWAPIGTSSSAFDFETWVSAGAAAPTVTANGASASAPEGTAPTMTGTFTDPNGGATLSADHGKVVAGAGGTWTWTGDAYDEDNAPSSVTVTVTDSTGQTATAKFSLVINRMKPAASISAAGAIVAAATTTAAGVSRPEGSTVTLNGSATSVDAADQAAGFTFSWTVTNGSSTSAPVEGPSFTLPQTDEGTFTVTMTAKDDGGVLSDPVSVTVTESEVKPAPSITGITRADPTVTFNAPEQTLNFTGTVGDASPEPHTFRWDFGDGSSSTLQNPSHAYASGGTYTVTFTVSDDEKVAGSATATVKVLTSQEAIGAMTAYVQGLRSLNAGQQNSLIAKLNAASDAMARGNNTAAHNQLNAFINEIDADYKTGRISSTAYNALRADAHAVQGALGTYNRFLEWWPLPA